ncbi:MAG: T9SS type A sorting domain-containing protein [Candidatus Sabulitectum sp.]|nr:T9SS type A sorting domain-containing protein [Candidatus Sabulitectum sp.]
MRITLACAMLVGICVADGLETQTDWVGGPGTPGPVTTWGDLFDASSGIFFATSGQIDLNFEHIVSTTDTGPRWTACADIDGDADIDILCGVYVSDSLVWFENTDGDGCFWTRHHIDEAYRPSRVTLADIDSDGDQDAIGGYHTADSVSWYENDGTGGGWIHHSVSNDVNIVKGLVAIDVNDDTFIDIVATSSLDDYVAWYQNDGTGGGWTKHVIATTNSPSCEDVADLNGDGYLDIVVAGYTADSLTWWENDGTGLVWTRHTISGSLNGARGAWFADIDDDGYLDVICGSAVGDSICWFENENDIGTNWVRHTIAIYDGLSILNHSDLDQDGDEDVLVCGVVSDNALWYENNGSGTSWTTHVIVDDYTGPMFVNPIDINSDGVLEVLVSDSYSNVLAWYDLFESTGVLKSSILDAQEDPDWGSIDWTATTPPSTDVIFQLRSSENPSAMGSWSADITSPGLIASYVTDGDNFIQYRVFLATTDMGDTSALPILEDVTLNWTMVSIADPGRPVDVFTLRIMSANPCFGAPVIAFSVPHVCNVNLSVFDMSGRVVARIADGEIEAGSYQVNIENLVPGVYHCSMEAGEFADVQRLVVLK